MSNKLYQVNGMSMFPALKNDQYVATKNIDRELSFGDIVILKCSKNGFNIIHRVLLGSRTKGDYLKSYDDELYSDLKIDKLVIGRIINDCVIQESWIIKIVRGTLSILNYRKFGYLSKIPSLLIRTLNYE